MLSGACLGIALILNVLAATLDVGGDLFQRGSSPDGRYGRSASGGGNSTVDQIRRTFAGLFGKSGRFGPSDRGAIKRSAEVAKWHEWTKWSGCSVSCGKGREIRWRHCKEHCKEVEIEMQERTCQLPACPRKLFGLIDLR